jgi:hypothetical protein
LHRLYLRFRHPKSTHRLQHNDTAYKLVLTFLFSLTLWSCRNLQTPSTPNIEPTSPTASPTFTFPTLIPSSTPTSIPVSTPTPSALLEIGELQFKADFDSDRGWDLRETDRGGSSIHDGRLNLAVRQPNAFFFIRVPAPEQSDFYFEVSLRSEVCEQDDEFGMMYRLGPFYDHYRFTLTCEGLARVLRVSEENEIVLIPSTQTYTVIPGLRVDNQLAVWASGSQFRFLINDREVFSIQDDELSTGGFGLFVRSRRSQQTTVSFDYLRISDVHNNATPTINPDSETTPQESDD